MRHAAALALATVLAGCLKPATPPPPSPRYAVCPSETIVPIYTGSCDGQSTPEGYQCVWCSKGQSCVAPWASSYVYCVDDQAVCSDQTCLWEPSSHARIFRRLAKYPPKDPRTPERERRDRGD